ncbi:MAG TPA: 50S ribosomal protein L11 methyltransferase [candidate division Zixibacteria bacterium]|nr:50S ribosomal protein L11 methyltransferase [candidate division Zixibacteria bacterium]
MPSSWLELSVRTHPSALDSAANFLIEKGSPGVVLGKARVKAYFPRENGRAAPILGETRRFLRRLARFFPGGEASELRWRILPERDWNRSWRSFFSPQKIGRRFLVAPPWDVPGRPGRRLPIVIEPGQAFGTGTHATTRGCLELIEQVDRLLGKKRYIALDVGTGSGILAIALAKLGAAGVVALDNDPLALKAAGENLRRNGVAGKVRLSRAGVARLKKKFSLVVANLTAGTILEIAEPLCRRVSAGGFLILSGILEPQAEEVLRHPAMTRFRLLRRRREGEWATFLLRRA